VVEPQEPYRGPQEAAEPPGVPPEQPRGLERLAGLLERLAGLPPELPGRRRPAGPVPQRFHLAEESRGLGAPSWRGRQSSVLAAATSSGARVAVSEVRRG